MIVVLMNRNRIFDVVFINEIFWLCLRCQLCFCGTGTAAAAASITAATTAIIGTLVIG